MNLRRYNRAFAAAFASTLFVLVAAAATPRQDQRANREGRDVRILVTVHPHDEKSRLRADSLKPEDFSVREDGRLQRIISVDRGAQSPIILAVLIQDDLVSRVGLELRGIKGFIQGLPNGSRVMTAYMSVGSLRVTQDFTADRALAARSLRIPVASSSGSPFSPYEQAMAAFRRFDSQPPGRRMVLMISDGLDLSHGLRSASPMMSMYLDQAIEDAQRRGIAVFGFYAPSVGLTSRSHLAINFGQGCLNRIADETGGDAFFTGTDFVSFDRYFKEMTDLLGRQWLITYRSSNPEIGHHKIEVTTDFELDLLYRTGYRLRERDIEQP